MSYYQVPDAPLEPPEDKRRRVYRCTICGDDILEGDEYYDITDFGMCCTKCIEGSHCSEAELDDGADEAYDRMCEEALM